MEALRKITPRTMGISTADIKTMLYADGKKDGDAIQLYTITGVMTGLKVGQSDNGPWSKLLGEFVAKTYDGKLYRSGQAFLPNFLNDEAVAAYKAGDGNPIEFAFDVGAKRVDDAAIGYEYIASARVALEQSNRMSLLLEKAGMTAEVRQIEGPKAETAKVRRRERA